MHVRGREIRGGALHQQAAPAERWSKSDADALARSYRDLFRRHHLGGALGAALLERCFALGWARRERDSRVVVFSPSGEEALRRALHG